MFARRRLCSVVIDGERDTTGPRRKLSYRCVACIDYFRRNYFRWNYFRWHYFRWNMRQMWHRGGGFGPCSASNAIGGEREKAGLRKKIGGVFFGVSIASIVIGGK